MFTFSNSEISSLISLRIKRAFLQKTRRLELRENVLLLSPGRYQEHLFFVKKGIIRCYYKGLQSEWIGWFAAEGDFAFSTESFLNGSPSAEYIETCTLVTLYQLTRQDCQDLLREFSDLNQVGIDTSFRRLENGINTGALIKTDGTGRK